jgi:hypothetical protein
MLTYAGSDLLGKLMQTEVAGHGGGPLSDADVQVSYLCSRMLTYAHGGGGPLSDADVQVYDVC